MNETPITYYRLSNGLRIVHCHHRSQVEYCGVTVNAGSRDENPEHYGLAHFVEHTIFKGTDRRRSWHIINRMEAVGGELNAFTTKEETTLYSVFPYGNLDRAVELQADLIAHSRFPQAEIDKEREVVADEIDSYLDTPSEAVFDDFDDLMYAGSSIGHNILGVEATLTTFTPETCRDYLSQYYVPENMVMFYSGATPADKVVRIAERHLGALNHPMPKRLREIPAVVAPFDVHRSIDSHQSHTIIGARIPGMYSDQRYAVALLTNILGGPGMNSLLNVALRERRGLVYTVDATTAIYTDSGTLTVYFGCDPADTKRCRRLAMQQLERLASKAMSARALEAAKKQYIGQLAVASENREQMALSMGRAMLYHGSVAQPAETIERIRAITPIELLDVATLIAPERCSTLTLGC